MNIHEQISVLASTLEFTRPRDVIIPTYNFNPSKQDDDESSDQA